MKNFTKRFTIVSHYKLWISKRLGTKKFWADFSLWHRANALSTTAVFTEVSIRHRTSINTRASTGEREARQQQQRISARSTSWRFGCRPTTAGNRYFVISAHLSLDRPHAVTKWEVAEHCENGVNWMIDHVRDVTLISASKAIWFTI
jgi:hypothetical protein